MFEEIAPYTKYLVAVVILVAAFVVYKLLSRSVSRFCKKFGVKAQIENSLRLMLRILVVIVCIGSFAFVFGLPIEWLVGGSAFIGAILGFASTQTLGNLLAGLYIVLSRPFEVKDFIKIGDLEGQVEEISINYTKIYTPSRNLMEVPNIQVLNSRILHCTKENTIDYSFNVGFDHQLSDEELVNECIEPAVEEFYNKHRRVLPERPKYYLATSDRLGRSFMVRVFFRRGEARTLYNLQPELMQMIVRRWDNYRLKKSQTKAPPV